MSTSRRIDSSPSAIVNTRAGAQTSFAPMASTTVPPGKMNRSRFFSQSSVMPPRASEH